MRTILTTEQWPAYDIYKIVLRAQLKGMPLPQRVREELVLLPASVAGMGKG